MAHIGLARAIGFDVLFGVSKSPEETLSNAVKWAQKAVELDNSLAEAQAALSSNFVYMRQHDKAIEAGEQAAL